MNWSRWRSRRFLVGTATSAAVVALIAIGVPAAALATHPATHAHPSAIGPGYPPPGGIYTPFTNCPLLNPIMAESTSGDATGCVAGEAATGSITIGNITTPVVRPVNVQFGLWDPPNAANGGDNPNSISQFIGGVLPPPAGISAMISTKRDLIPMSLTTALGCPSTNQVVEDLCVKAENFGGKYNDVYALATSVGQLTNFALFSWTQRVAFRLINPLLGNNCYIGSPNNPVVLNPQLSLAPGGTLEELPDPNPTKHPNTVVLEITAAIATDNVFSAPGVTGCGPGGSANIAVDEALDAGAGVPAASGVNSLTLNGAFYIADCYNSADQAKILLSAFKDSSKSAGPRESGRRISFAEARKLFRHFGVH